MVVIKTEMGFRVRLVIYLLLIGRWTFNLRSVCHFVKKISGLCTTSQGEKGKGVTGVGEERRRIGGWFEINS